MEWNGTKLWQPHCSNQQITSIHKTVKLFQLDPSFRTNVLITHIVSVSFLSSFVFLDFSLEWLTLTYQSIII